MTATNLLIDTAGLLDVSELAPEANGTRQSVRNEGRLDYIAALALDSYRIALIAPQVSSSEHPWANRLGSGRLVILPLTWKQFLVEVQKCASDATNANPQVRRELSMTLPPTILMRGHRTRTGDRW